MTLHPSYPSYSMRQDAGSRGFSLIEVIITIAILMSLTIGVVVMMRGAIDLRSGLSVESKITQRLNNAMAVVSRDITHAILISKNDKVRYSFDRNMKTVFKVEAGGDTDKLMLTTLSHRPLRANSHESDQIYVVYQVSDSPDIPGRKNLYRGQMPITNRDLKEEPSMRLLARNIKKFRIMGWRGDQWVKDRWDSDRSDTANKIPRMIRVEIATWADDPVAGDVPDPSQDNNVVELKTIVAPPLALGFNDMKQQTSSVSWYAGRD